MKDKSPKSRSRDFFETGTPNSVTAIFSDTEERRFIRETGRTHVGTDCTAAVKTGPCAEDPGLRYE